MAQVKGFPIPYERQGRRRTGLARNVAARTHLVRLFIGDFPRSRGKRGVALLSLFLSLGRATECALRNVRAASRAKIAICLEFRERPLNNVTRERERERESATYT